MSIRRIDATFRVTTPMFCGGADAKNAELRLPSLKGVLRYWWRALAWSDCDGDLGKIKKKEDDLFGSAEGGQSRVQMRFLKSPSPSLCDAGQVLRAPGVGYGTRYLGYGVMKAGELTRACSGHGLDFTVQMRVSSASEPSVALLKSAVIAVGCLSGIGAKSRKGYGSLTIRSLVVDKESFPTPSSLMELRTTIAGLYQQHRVSCGGSEYPEYTAFSRHARHVLLTSGKREPLGMLDLVGREVIRYRSWGREGKILGQHESEKNFKDDHDLMKDVETGGRPDKHPERVAFGLPHNYGPRQCQQVGPSDKYLDRRASPLFIHIHECVEGPVAVLSFLPARFLPDRCGIRVGRHKVRQLSEERLYGPVTRFLDRLLNQGEGTVGECERKEDFGDAVEVRP